MTYNSGWKFPRKTILVDFDGTLAPFSWPKKPGPPYPGVVDALRGLREKGFTIIIFTTRAWKGWIQVDGPDFYHQQMTEVTDWLNRWGVPFDDITAEKVPCMFIVDDRSLNPTFHTWEQIAEIVSSATEKDKYGTQREEDDAE